MTSIFVAKLDFGVSTEELKAAFEQFGSVAKVTIATDKETGKPRGFAFVEMFDDNEAQEAIKHLDGYAFNGRNCVVKEAEDRSKGKPSNKPAGRSDFKPRQNFQRNESKGPQSERPAGNKDEDIPFRKPQDDDSDDSSSSNIKPTIKRKVDKPKVKTVDNTADGKGKKPKMNAYKKSGKDQVFDEDELLDEDIDLFGRDEDEELDEDYSKYLVNSDDDDEWDDDEEWDDEDIDNEEDY